MINIFVAAAIAFLFWGKMTKDEEDKIQNAGWVRPLIYFTLSLLVGVFYIKTYKVATIKNLIQVKGYRTAQSIKTGENVDTIETIDVMNRFTNSLFYANLLETSGVKYDSVIADIDSLGGIYILHRLRYDSLCTLETHDENIAFKSSNNDGHDYSITYIATKLPSMSLIQRKFDKEDLDSLDKEGHYYHSSQISDLSDIRIENSNNFINSFGKYGLFNEFNESTFDLDSTNIYNILLRNTLNSAEINTFGFFTAADISQCSYSVSINSDCPVKRMSMTFDIPVEISPIPYKIDENSAYGFIISDSIATKEIQHANILMHVKFPTLANMQLIRSLILTTLLSALLTLFLSNFFFLICRGIRWLKKKINIPYEQKQINLRRNLYRTIVVIISIIILTCSLLVLNDKFISLCSKSFRITVFVFMGMISLIVLGIIKFEITQIEKAEKASKKDNKDS